MPTASNVVLFRLPPSTRPLKFLPCERAALIALAYIYAVSIAFNMDADGNEDATVLPDDGGWAAANAYPVPGGIWVNDEAGNHLGTFGTPKALVAILTGHLTRLEFDGGCKGHEGA